MFPANEPTFNDTCKGTSKSFYISLDGQFSISVSTTQKYQAKTIFGLVNIGETIIRRPKDGNGVQEKS